MIITIFILNPTKVSFLGIRPRYFSKSSLRFLQQPECIRTFSNMSDIVVRKDINNLAIRNLTKTKINYKFDKVIIPFKELTEIKFLNILLLNLKLDTLYTILFQYTLYENNINFMLGPQVGINVKETHNLEYYRNLYEHLLEKLSIIMESYNVEAPDFITLIMKELVLEETIKKGVISKIEISKGLGKIGEVKRNFNSSILPFTYNEKYFGNLLQGSLKLEFLNKLIDQLEENKLTSYSTNTIPSNINSLKNVDFTEIEVSD